jgi:hypothetical protein
MYKKILSIVIITSFLMFVISCSNQPGGKSTETKDTTKTAKNEPSNSSVSKKYGIKSGIVTYDVKVSGMNTIQNLYFDDYGAKEARVTVTEMNMFGSSIRKVTVSLEKDGYRYNYELENIVNKENKTKKEIRKTKVFSMGSSDMSGMASSMSKEMKKQYDYKEEGTETVAGVTGEKFSMKFGQGRMSGVIYKKIMLKTTMDMMTMTAEKFEENASVPADKFELPKDYTIVESN